MLNIAIFDYFKLSDLELNSILHKFAALTTWERDWKRVGD